MICHFFLFQDSVWNTSNLGVDANCCKILLAIIYIYWYLKLAQFIILRNVKKTKCNSIKKIDKNSFETWIWYNIKGEKPWSVALLFIPIFQLFPKIMLEFLLVFSQCMDIFYVVCKQDCQLDPSTILEYLQDFGWP